jgi:hypothetical protein
MPNKTTMTLTIAVSFTREDMTPSPRALHQGGAWSIMPDTPSSAADFAAIAGA